MRLTMDPLPIEVIVVGDDEIIAVEGLCFGVVTLVIEFAAGALSDPPTVAGATNLAFQMLERGTRRRRRAAFHEALDQLGADLGVSVGRTRVRLSLRCFESELEAAVDLLLEALFEPLDAPDELATLRRELAEEVEVQLEEPGGILGWVAPSAMWPSGAAGHPVEGRRRTRGRVRPRALARARTQIRSAPIRIGLAADHPTRLRPIVDRLLLRLRDGSPATQAPQYAPPIEVGTGRVVGIPFPDAEQSEIRMLMRAPCATSPDWPALLVYNAAFSAGFSAPLPRAIRAEAGLSYVVDARFQRERGESLLVVEMAPQATEAARAVRLARETAQRFASEVRACDVAAVVQQLAGNHRIAIETAEQRLTAALALRRRGSEVQELWTVLERLGEITCDDLVRVSSLFGLAEAPALVLFAGGRGAEEPGWSEWSHHGTLESPNLNALL
jgi:zinc protease